MTQVFKKVGKVGGNPFAPIFRLSEKKEKVAAKMKPYKISKQKKGESDRDHWHRLAKEFYEHGKNLPKGKPASFYKGKV